MALTKVSGEVIKRPLILTNDASISGILTVGTGSTTTTIDGSFEYPTIRPTLDLNFAATKTLDSRISFSRDSIGSYVGEDGLIKYASNNVPRFDHDITTRESLGLLIEDGRTNYIDNSNDLSQWNRVINGGTTAANTTETLSPDGTNNSTKVIGTTNSGMSRDALFSASASTTYISSIFAKKGTADSFKIELGTGPNNVQTVFNLTTKTFSASAAQGWFASVSTSYVEYPNGWVRVILSGTTSASPSGTPNYAVYGITGGYIYFWGAQVEQGTFITSLIPTHGSTVTRTTDIAKITGTNFTSFYTAEEFTLYGDGRSITGSSDVGGNPALVSIDDNTGNNRFILRRWDPGGATPRSGFTFRYRRADINLNMDAFPYGTSGGYDATGDLPDWQDASLHKIVFGVNNNSQVPQDIAGYGDGFDANFAVTNPGEYTGTEILTPYTAATQMQIGFGAASARWNGQISSIKYYPKRLPDAQLKGLTHH